MAAFAFFQMAGTQNLENHLPLSAELLVGNVVVATLDGCTDYALKRDASVRYYFDW
jgi:hypothetical protein